MTRAAKLLALVTAAMAAVLFHPSVALACPVCAVDNNAKVMKIAAVFLAVPFVIAILVIRAIVRANRDVNPL